MALRTYDHGAYVWCLTAKRNQRKIPTRKRLPLCFVSRWSVCSQQQIVKSVADRGVCLTSGSDACKNGGECCAGGKLRSAWLCVFVYLCVCVCVCVCVCARAVAHI